MKIFGINFTTKKELKEYNVELMCEIEDLLGDLEAAEEEIQYMHENFPFDLGQVVYDVTLKNVAGRFTKTEPSFEYSTISEVTVDEKNYFGLVNRLKSNDVFIEREEAEEFLKSICV